MRQDIFEGAEFFLQTLNALPFPALVVDEDLRIVFWNSAAQKLLRSEELFQQRGGEVLHCLHSTETSEGCGHSPSCKNCVVRNSVGESIRGNRVYRKKTVMEIISGETVTETPMLITTSPLHHNEQALTVLVLEDIRELMQIGSILPICAKCKKIRTTANQWEPVERYIKTHIVEVDFSHGLCPECIRDVFSAE